MAWGEKARFVSPAELATLEPGVNFKGARNVAFSESDGALDPMLGFSPVRSDVYLAVTHSGVSLAPIVGQLAAREMINGVSSGRLDNYRPDRSYKSVKYY